MHTVLIFNSYDYGLKFYVVEGDWSRFDGIYINESDNDPKLQDELSELMYDEAGEDRYPALDKFPVEAVRAGANVTVCGFLP